MILDPHRARTLLSILALTFVLVSPSSAATVDGLKIHWTSTGKGPETVILVHGWTCDETTWRDQVPALAKSYRVVTLDLPGHGKSDSPKAGAFSMDLFARAVEAVRQDVRAERVVLVGHSMGTPVVFRYATLFPTHTAALVLVDGLVTAPPAPPPGTPPLAQQMSGPEGRQVRERFIRGMFSGATTPEMQSRIVSMMMAAPEATALGAFNAVMDPAWQTSDVVTVPVLGLYAEKSALGNREALKARFPSLEYVEIPQTGHFLMIEKPDAFNSQLLAFLKKQKY
jgi:pimeloyl-ACP methyl ester carboxylesterase